MPHLRSSLFARLARDKRGVSAVEFALVAPLMVGLYLGCAEISDGVAADRKVSLTTASIANLAAQTTSITSTQMDNIINASTAIIYPYSASNLKITLSCLNIDTNKNVTVKWTRIQNGGVVGNAPPLPSALLVANTQLIYGRVTYTYKPTIGYTITGTLTLSDQMYMMPRITAPSYNGISCGT
ncbi:MAG TPA: TadE/TadG family type IV pilus assembly protein [Pseudolabrys sp.]|jgi:Flp pilus assembly protein TadG